MADSRRFDIGDILTVTTGRLVAPRGIGAVYEILNFMTGDNIFTHQIPRAMDECGPHLIEQHPWLGSPEVADAVRALGGLLRTADREDVPRIVAGWLRPFADAHGSMIEVRPVPAESHARIDPRIEAEMMTDSEVIMVRPEP